MGPTKFQFFTPMKIEQAHPGERYYTMPYEVNTYVQYCKTIPFYFKDMSMLNAERFTSYRISPVAPIHPPGAVAILWIWSKYAPRDSAGWRSTGRHCYLNFKGHRIPSGPTTQFEICADAWLAHVRAQNEEHENFFEDEVTTMIDDIKMSRPL